MQNDNDSFQPCPICGVRGLHGCLGPQKTDERLCTNVLGGLVCGRPEFHEIHHPRNFTKLGHPFEEAAPSTDKEEARPPGAFKITWNRMLGGYRVSIPMYEGEWVIPLEELAAIRAPLEERIRELERQLAFWREESFSSMQTRDVYHSRAEAAEADNERLREALRDTASHLNMASLVVDTALLPSPPSSTEGTE